LSSGEPNERNRPDNCCRHRWGAIGTVGAVTRSLYFALREGRHRRKREHRQQAEQVTAWIDGSDANTIQVQLRNSSDQPAYELIISLVAVQGAFRKTAVDDQRTDAPQLRRLVGLVPPGETITTLTNRGGGMHLQLGLEVAFQDAAGRFWLREGQGTLRQVDESPLQLYDIPQPASWQRT
jgi:hypothetical protein